MENVAIVTGATDLILKVRVESIDALNSFVTDKLRNVESIDTTQTLVILKEF